MFESANFEDWGLSRQNVGSVSLECNLIDEKQSEAKEREVVLYEFCSMFECM